MKAKFREDLFYRLAVVPFSCPPLRERKDDMNRYARMLSARIAPGE